MVWRGPASEVVDDGRRDQMSIVFVAVMPSMGTRNNYAWSRVPHLSGLSHPTLEHRLCLVGSFAATYLADRDVVYCRSPLRSPSRVQTAMGTENAGGVVGAWVSSSVLSSTVVRYGCRDPRWPLARSPALDQSSLDGPCLAAPLSDPANSICCLRIQPASGIIRQHVH